MKIFALNKEIIEFDVLILGAGLSGMRAAYSAYKENSKLDIGVVSLHKGASGSSFCNFNGRLGMQVLVDDKQKELFFKRAKSIALPGFVDEALVRIEAEESEKRFLELAQIGVRFNKDKDNNLLKCPGCFLPEIKSAVIIEDVKQCFEVYYNRLRGCVKFLLNFVVLDLITYQKEIVGVLLFDKKRKKLVYVKTKCVVCALGGSGSLFPWTNSWKNSASGYGLALLKKAGARVVNSRFIQMLWLKKRDFSFFSHENFKHEKLFIKKENQFIEFPLKFYNLIDQRVTHCPIGYELDDFVLDKFLLRALDSEGVLIKGKNKEFFVVPAAQASNGGAYIDIRAMTNIEGLFACGECASGMHGANRIGGAMVLSTQVFGHRAGKFAAKKAKEKKFLSDKLFTNLMNEVRFSLDEGIGIISFEKFRDQEGVGVHFVKGVLLRDKNSLDFISKFIEKAEADRERDRVFQLKMDALKLIFEI